MLPGWCAGGEIIMSESVREAYSKGRGGVLVRAKMHIEDPNNPAATAAGNGAGAGKKRARRSVGSTKPAVVITELPYQTNKVRRGGRQRHSAGGRAGGKKQGGAA